MSEGDLSANVESAQPSVSVINNDDTHGVDPVLLAQIIDMGFERNIALRSLYYCQGNSIDAALSWMSEYSHEELQTLASKPISDDSHEWVDVDEEQFDNSPKMVFVINMELKMKPGKISAQVAHAALDLYRKIESRSSVKYKLLLNTWNSQGETMVVLKGTNTEHLRDLRNAADSKRMPCSIVTDAGRTQVEPGSQTVLAILGTSGEIDSITGKLKLL